MPNLTAAQTQHFEELLYLYEQHLTSARDEQGAMMLAFKEFSLDLAERSAQVTGAPANKNQVIARLRGAHEWTEDWVIFHALQNLGYQATLTLAGTHLGTYLPYELRNNTALRMDLVNQGARDGGVHWRLKAVDNRGGGNCGYEAPAQQLLKDMPYVFNTLLQTPARTLATKSTVSSVAPAPAMTPRQSTGETIAEVKRLFGESDRAANQRKATAIQYFNTHNLSTPELIALFQTAKANCGGDSFLTNRHAVLKQDYAHYGQYADFFERAVSAPYAQFCKPTLSGESYAAVCEEDLRQELTHALVTEAWRSPSSFERMLSLVPSVSSGRKLTEDALEVAAPSVLAIPRLVR